MFITLISIAAIIVIGVFLVIGIYNKLVTLKNRFENAFSQIEVQLQRRYDLIPNLIETVKGYMKHERETLEAVIQARNQAAGSLKAASQNPGDAGAIAGLAERKVCLAKPWVVFSHFQRVTRTLRPIKIWPICRN